MATTDRVKLPKIKEHKVPCEGGFFHPRSPVDITMDPRLQYIGYDGPSHLNIGSGVNPIPGATNVDIQPFLGVNLTFDFREPWPINDAAYDKVTMFECLEHTDPWRAFGAVKEAFRVLKVAGVFIVEVPDIDGMCQELLNGNYGMLTGGIYGGYENPADGHFFGYTKSSLALMCHLAGFIRVVSGPGKDYHRVQIPTLRVEAVKVSKRDGTT